MVGANGAAPLFIFADTGNILDGYFLPSTGDITFSVNGGPAQPITFLESSYYVPASASRTNTFAGGSGSSFAVGSVVVFSAGTETSTMNFPDAAPAAGTFRTYLSNYSDYSQNSADGISVAPEPSAWMWLAVAGISGAVVRSRRGRLEAGDVG